MEQFSDREKQMYYPQWVPDEKGGGQTVKSQEDHAKLFPDHYDEWLSKLNPPPKSEEELNGAIQAEREACIKFVDGYPTHAILAKEIAKALRKSRNAGGFNAAKVLPTGSLNKSTAKSDAAARAKVNVAQGLDAEITEQPELAPAE